MSKTDAAWAALSKAAEARRDRRIDSLFAAEPDRLSRLGVSAAGLDLDLSKHPWSLADLATLLELARGVRPGGRGPRAAAQAVTRLGRPPGPAMALPARRKGRTSAPTAQPVSAEVEATLRRQAAFAEAVRSGRRAAPRASRSAPSSTSASAARTWGRGWSGGAEAAQPADRARFVANVDPAELAAGPDRPGPRRDHGGRGLQDLHHPGDPDQRRGRPRPGCGRRWGPPRTPTWRRSPPPRTRPRRSASPADQVFGFWDWVGGRYSIWSAVGLSCAVGLGWDVFARLLAGARAMDEHFRAARRWPRNAPVLLALAHIVQPQRPGRPIRAVHPLRRSACACSPAFLQQLEMESNGKRGARPPAPWPAPPPTAVFGDAGTNGQHAFFQLLHQGTRRRSRWTSSPCTSTAEGPTRPARQAAGQRPSPRPRR